jgi:hypothetical protein
MTKAGVDAMDAEQEARRKVIRDTFTHPGHDRASSPIRGVDDLFAPGDIGMKVENGRRLHEARSLWKKETRSIDPAQADRRSATRCICLAARRPVPGSSGLGATADQLF